MLRKKRFFSVLLCFVLILGILPVTALEAEGENGNLSEHIIDTVSPAHVTFNLFDYWVNTQDSDYITGWGIQKGINQGHPLLFSDGSAGNGPYNAWTGNADHYNAQPANPGIRYGEYKGIVNQTLQNGYPVLALDDDFNDPQKGQPAFIKNNDLQPALTESLAYLFDPDSSNDYKAVYENVQGLVKYDGNGGYVYNSHENYAAFQASASGALGTNGEPSAGYFEVYDNWGLTSGGSPNGQFFPFDGADEVFRTDGSGNYQTDADGKLVPRTDVKLDTAQTPLNHFMGLTMETVFLQPENGKIDANTPMSFTFSGDDDVWIFIDNVLVSDLGGIHDECFTIIDFETGVIYTGLTPMVKNADGTYSEAMPALEDLKNAENGTDTKTEWTWFDRTNKTQTENKTGDYEAFKAAHGIQITTLKEIFDAADQSDAQVWGDGTDMSGNTFDQNTQHELKMFYLERGAGASNLVLEFNMLAVPASGITKTDQDGNPVSGATFELWPAQVSSEETDEYGFAAPVLGEDGLYVADKSSGIPICSAVTDGSGHLNFITENRKIISFQERAQADKPQLYYVLEETGIPPGYRSRGNVSLYYSIYNRKTREGVLLSYNYWQTGAYTQAKLDVTMTEELYEYTVQNGQAAVGERIGAGQADIEDYLDNGIIFAVPIKRIDMEGSLYDESNFYALYGTANTGWTMMQAPITDKGSVLEAARSMMRVMQENYQSGTIIAERNARQLFHIEVSNIPGDVKLSYPYLEAMGNAGEAQYNVAFYFAPNADSLDDIDPDTIVRIAARTRAGESFDRQYASQFYVPNTLNRVRVQKLNYQGSRLEDAEFTMYQTYSTWKRDENYVQVPKGSADEDHVGMYRNTAAVNEDGTLKGRADILNTVYWDRGKTSSEGAVGTGGLDLDGAIIFPTAFDKYAYGGQTGGYQVNSDDTSTYMEEGEYIILETTAPSGYQPNESMITVTVNGDGVFADAGERGDGVRVGQYTGWILNSLSQFAAEGPVDETLTFVKTNLKVMDGNGTLESPVEGDMTWQNKYSNQNHRYIALAEDVGRYITAGRNLYQYTDEGTPRLVIQQNQDVAAKVIVFLGTDAAGNDIRYSGPVTVNKKNADGTIYSLDGWASDGTLAFWLQKAGTQGGAQTLDSVVVNGKTLELNKDYRIYTPNVEDLSGYTDLSGLFSVETLVQVFDQGYGSLAVTKKTENTPEGSALKEDEIFHFRVYSVYENAAKLVLAKTQDGEPVMDPETGKPEVVDFTGTLNVRLRQTAGEGQSTQDTATSIAVEFVNGKGMFYLQPGYDAEYVFIPENRNHPAYDQLEDDEGLVGLVETRITLSDSDQDGQAVVTARHVAFSGRIHKHTVTFADGTGILYRNPDYEITEVSFGAGGPVYTTGGASTFTADNRFQYASPDKILDVPVQGEVDAVFTEEDGTSSSEDRVVVNSRLQNVSDIGDGDVTVYQNGDGYKLAYSLSSNTSEQAIVAQFALHSGQTITVSQLPVGANYYVYEYAVGEDGSRTDLENWDTDITWDQTADGIYQRIEGYRAVRGAIALDDGAAQSVPTAVVFTNKAHVGQLTISKTVTGEQMTDEDKSRAFTFTVALKDEDGKPLQGDYPYTGEAVDGTPPLEGILSLDESGRAEISLTHGQSITISQIPDNAVYEVSESAVSGFIVVTDGDADEDQIAEGTVAAGQTSNARFTNVKQSSLSFTKVAAEDTGQPLEGAEFRLFRLNCSDTDHDHEGLIDPENPGECWQQEGESRTSDTDGGVSFGELSHNSEYRLVETRAPAGYALPEGQWRVMTDGNNSISIAAVGGQDGRLPTAFAVNEDGKLLLPNARPMNLPFTGTWGIWPFLIAGGVLMLIAVGIIAGRKLYRKHNISKNV